MIPPAVLAVLRRSLVLHVLPDRSGFVVALPDDGPAITCPCLPGRALMVAVVRQVVTAGGLEAAYSCVACDTRRELAA